MVICLEQGADLHMAQLMPLLLTVSCSSKIQIGFTFLVLAHLGCPGHRAVKRVCVIIILRDFFNPAIVSYYILYGYFTPVQMSNYVSPLSFSLFFLILPKLKLFGMYFII